ncbi:MAG TPA: hypothetical protein VGM39_20090 [Kofleriaceae bacterium]|jgi:hypothetical protein
MKATVVIAALALAGCKDRGTISIPLEDPCKDTEPVPPDGTAVYFVRGESCPDFTCMAHDFACNSGKCTSACASGYCTQDELDNLSFVPEPGDYAVVFLFHYPGEATDGAFACYTIQVDADGTTDGVGSAGPDHCCMMEGSE